MKHRVDSGLNVIALWHRGQSAEQPLGVARDEQSQISGRRHLIRTAEDTRSPSIFYGEYVAAKDLAGMGNRVPRDFVDLVHGA